MSWKRKLRNSSAHVAWQTERSRVRALENIENGSEKEEKKGDD